MKVFEDFVAAFNRHQGLQKGLVGQLGPTLADNERHFSVQSFASSALQEARGESLE